MPELVLERLRQGPLLCDGGMGTMLYSRAPEVVMHGRSFDELVLTAPELVQAIHREYILAGAQIIETNTFGANAAKLNAYGLADKVSAINRQAAQLAREAREVAGQTVFIAGAVGPSGEVALAGSGDDAPHLLTLRAMFRDQITALMEGGVELLILETFSSLVELRQGVLAAREAGDLPIIAQMTFSEDGQTLAGESPAEVARALVGMGVNIIGSNCSVGPAGILDAVTEMASTVDEVTGGAHASGDILLTAQPNAGLPQRVENRFLYVSTPQYFGEYARRFAEAGVRLIGGCCGTTPAHIAAMHEALAGYQPATRAAFAVAAAPTTAATTATSAASVVEAPSTPRTLAEAATTAAPDEQPRTRLSRDLAAGRFVVSIELDPPKGLNPSKIIDGAAYLANLGVEYINIADSPMARVRMSCMALARLLQDQLGVETIIHATTRDRNLMALQSDLLGAHALGIHNILALTGDPLRAAGNYPNLTGVWDVDSVGLMRVLRGMNEGHDAAGASLGLPAHFFIGAALNLNMEESLIDVERERTRRKLLDPIADPILADDQPHPHGEASLHDHAHLTEIELELHRLRHKLDAGAHYIMTQPIYSLEPLEAFYERFGPVDVPVILGMIPLHSSKHAEYLHNEVPGISIPDDVRARMRAAGDHGREVGIQIAHEIITEARSRGLIHGCYLMPSYGRYDLVGELARELLRTSAPERAAAD